MTDLDYTHFEALTFDCYGTLIDWETGILAALRPILGRRGVEPPDDELLARFASSEAAAEGGPYRRYREVLGLALDGIASSYGFEPEASERAAFGGSVGDWPAFPDSRRRSRASSSASALASSRTATTTCSRDPRRAWRPGSIGS